MFRNTATRSYPKLSQVPPPPRVTEQYSGATDKDSDEETRNPLSPKKC